MLRALHVTAAHRLAPGIVAQMSQHVNEYPGASYRPLQASPVRSYPSDHLLGDHIRFTVRSQTEGDPLIDVISMIYTKLVGVPRS
jgi:hypothetical protein